MQKPDQSVVMVTSIVHDFMFIQVKDQQMENNTIAYKICNASDEIIRKGSFRGLMIQLRLIHLKEGNYNIHLFLDETTPMIIPFEKKPPAQADSISLRQYS